ncbi:MAG: hypothetical protein KJ787_08795 [Gammaproteobacteria bacterium]|nr:hypothetical protein [Gammaproteobacteria bacterium]MBU1646417.1 hypothetical protein [Gammaproteobacteria bacterium]MBU1970960.1 hypothetical protein [Gammaproteobacteria bacterium]
MIFQPAIIALLLASAICVLALAASAPFAVELVRRWDINSGSERQLRLERRTYLFSTLLVFIMTAQLASVLLFVFNAEKMSGMFVGAMCAVGTLNVNPWGFPALNAKIAVFFLAAMWLAINHVDSRARDYPLVRIKYALLLLLAPLLAASAWTEAQFFLNLKADVITSCCGSLFSEGSTTLAAEASAMEPLPAMLLFYGAMGLAIGSASYQWAFGKGGYATATAAALGFAAGISGILAFISLYIYEHPHHHCPFCVLKPEYGYQGYALYIPLFLATAAGLATGAIRPFAGIASLKTVVAETSRRLAAVASIGFLLTTAVATAMILRSNLILLEH